MEISTEFFQLGLQKLQERSLLHERAIEILSNSLSVPTFYRSEKTAGFRYDTPGPLHFCLLKAVRAVSGINACVVLARSGYNQEVCTLIRTIIDAYTQIDFVLSGYSRGVLNEKQQTLLGKFFSDYDRNSADDLPGSLGRQEDIHKSIDTSISYVLRSQDCNEFKDLSIEKLMSTVYRTYSNYVHARYPEVMDMWGGDPAQFHLRGMSQTPKDWETLMQLNAFSDAVDITLRKIIIQFGFKDQICSIPHLSGWINSPAD